MSEFSSLSLHPELVQAVSALGYTEPTPIQAALIPTMIKGVDVIGQAQTGTGKTAAFALPILHNIKLKGNPGQDGSPVQALVLVPTRELAIQVAKAIHDYGKVFHARVLPVYGGNSYSSQINRIRRGVDIVVGTPGRLLDLIEKRSILDLSNVQTVVLDEADEMLSMGFIEDIESILKATPDTRQTALFSATMPTPIRRLADKYMHNPQSFTIERKQMTVEAIEQRYYLVNEQDKLAALTRLFEIEDITSALIFARTRAGTAELAAELNARGFPAELLNGDLNQDARERVMNRFRQNQITVMVATDVAARGLDIDNISHVFNYDLPDDPEVYVHRVGRTGRAGKTGIALSLVTPAERGQLRRIEGFARNSLKRTPLPTEEEIHQHREKGLLDRMMVWLNRDRYKREKEMVTALVEEGYDPINIAAAALKLARSEEKQRPIYSVSEVMETTHRSRQIERSRARNTPERRYDAERPARAPRSSTSHEPGMVRLSVGQGRAHGIRPSEIVASIAYFADIPGHALGKILIEDQHTFVDVPEQWVEKVLAKKGNFKMRKQAVTVELA
ncbi:MAG: DEAD/DEAH box helicase [Anaerolineales bacterium]|nr:DEAD/DEAH box helicase [Anaerolineales bacterium]